MPQSNKENKEQCLNCSKQVSIGMECDQCNHCFHYWCDGTCEEIVEKEYPNDAQYICR